jgi:hypothetical protein
MAMVDTRPGRQDHREMPESAESKRGLLGSDPNRTRRWTGRANRFDRRHPTMNLLSLIVIVLIISALVGAPGIGPWQHSYGYYPSGGIGLIVIILVVLLLMGRL